MVSIFIFTLRVLGHPVEYSTLDAAFETLLQDDRTAQRLPLPLYTGDDCAEPPVGAEAAARQVSSRRSGW